MSQENSGIGANVISLPQGGGAVGGMGETFSPDLFSGTGNFSVPIAVPSGRNGLQPELTLGYSSGNGNGFFGLGWAMSIPGVSRKTSLGVPQYDDDKDIFVLSGAEDLIPVGRTESVTDGISYRKTQYKPRTEGLFAQIFHHKKSNGTNYWEVKSKDGMVSFYGNPDPESDEHAQMRDPENKKLIAQWFLFKTVDVFGNEIRYEYDYHLVPDERAPFIQVYPKRIRYADYLFEEEKHYLCSVLFEYEDRPDPNSAFRNGFEVRTTQRCKAIKTFTHPQDDDLPEGYTADAAGNNIAVKTYHLTYQDEQGELPSNATSILVSVQPEGHSATEDEQMPPLSFGYTEFANDLRNFKEIKGKHLPVVNLNHPELTFADLNGNGLPDLVQASPGQPIRYWTNKGNGQFALPRSMAFSPQGLSLGDEGVQLMDADGDGRIDLVVNRPQTSGYFPLNHDGQWDRRHFIKYKQAPNFSLKTANVRMMDLTGDGRTDVLINGNRFECYFQNSPLVSDGPAEGLIREDYVAGWSGMRQVNKKSIEAFPNVNFDDPRIHTADMSGDGLQDIVEISNGRIAWWPNLGYGRFGSRRIMKKAPRFGQNFDPQRILLGDLNGDGLTDLVYLDNNKITYWVNHHGNAWGEANEVKGTPRFALGDSVQIVDLMGSGTPGILWSFERTGTQTRMYYLDLCRGVKPYVLNEMNNNMGAVTRVEYTSSIRHYLRDLYGTSASEELQTDLPDALDLFIGSAGKWKTTLPFPTQVVNRVEVMDEISEGKLTTHYFYHHGYWDGGEREFRGFGRVDQFDSEDFNHFNETSLHLDADFEGVSQAHYSPPMLVKNWFHLGPVGAATGDWDQLFFENEYHTSDPQVLPPSPETLQLLAGLPRRARRDAYRTLRGTALRTESYAVDGSNKQFKPYSVSETRPGLQLKDHPGNNPTIKMLANQRHSNHIFFSFTDGSRSTQWERGNDPMVSFSFSGDFDEYGQPRRALSAALPRGIMPPYTDATNINIEAHDGGGDILATLSLTDYVEPDPETNPPYIKDRVSRSLTYEISTSGLNVFEIREAVMNATKEAIIANTADVTLTNIGCQLNYYDGNAFTGLPFDTIGDYGAVVRSETLVLTDTIINAAYDEMPECFKTSPDWSDTNDYPTAFSGALQNNDERLGYKDRRTGFSDHVPGWYTEGERVKYDWQDGAIQNPVGLVLETKDVFENRSTMEYDDYKLFPIETRQWLNANNYLQTSADYDYRILQARKTTDPNNNITEFDFSPLGLLKATAMIGKGTEGDFKSASGGFYDRFAPSVFMEYDFLAWMENQQPVWVKTIQREKHYQQLAESPTIEQVEYSDGFGRLLQTRAQAEDIIFGDSTFGSSGLPADQEATNAPAIGIERDAEDPLNVVVSGWKVYNNKGEVVEQYEPFFAQGFDFQPAGLSDLGQKVIMFYDPQGRVIRTVNPDDTEQRVIIGIPPDLENPDNFAPTPWESYLYDANDLADITHPNDNNVHGSHYYTPKSEVIDALGRTIKTVEHEATENEENVVLRYAYDIRGNVLAVTDALTRIVYTHIYDLADKTLWSEHIDAGQKSVLYDTVANPIELLDQKGSLLLHVYDKAGRQKFVWAKDQPSEPYTVRSFIVYGDDPNNAPASPENDNLLGYIFKSYDESGLITISKYDFKANELTKVQQVIKDSLLLDAINDGTNNNWEVAPYRTEWSTEPWNEETNLLEGHYQTDLVYDALNRVVEIEYPADINSVRKKLIPKYNRAGALEKVTFNNEDYVNHIAYNAKGQRLLIAFGNDIMTRYTYDEHTFLLKRVRTESYLQIDLEFSSDGSLKEDKAYTYDFAGNIVAINEIGTDVGLPADPDELFRTFSYDALYRLIEATGREHNTSTNAPWEDIAADPSPNINNVTGYTRKFHYDRMGNMLKMEHIGDSSFTRIFNPDSEGDPPTEFGSDNLLTTFNVGTNTYDYQYDANGNMIKENSNRFFEWDHADRLRVFYNQAASGSEPSVYEQYLYNSAGERVKKITRKQSGIYEVSVYVDGFFEYQKKVNGTTEERNFEHILDDSKRIAELRTGSFSGDDNKPIKYLVEDHLQSVGLRLDENGTTLDREEYFPFGESSFRTTSKKRYRYAGKERDEYSGFYYHGARYYTSWLGRFVSVDAMAEMAVAESPFIYSANNPLIYVDPSGNQSEKADNIGGGGNNNRGANAQEHSDNIQEQEGIESSTDPDHTYTFPEFEVTPETNQSSTGQATNGGFWKGFGTAVLTNTANVIISAIKYAVDNPANAGYGGFGTKTPTQEQVKEYKVDWSKQLDPYFQIESFAESVVNTGVGVYQFGEGVAEGDGTKAGNAVGDVAITVGAITLLKKSIPGSGVRSIAPGGGVQSFQSFSAFKRAMGPAGPGKAWHHIVEQNPANLGKFGADVIHTTSNVIKLPHGAGSIHAKISGHYSSIQRYTGGKTVRKWLNTKSFEFQRNYGIQKLKEFGWTP